MGIVAVRVAIHTIIPIEALIILMLCIYTMNNDKLRLHRGFEGE
jgi:hypothetical protein